MLLEDTRAAVRVGEMPLQTAPKFRAELGSVAVGLVVVVVVHHPESSSERTTTEILESERRCDAKPKLNGD